MCITPIYYIITAYDLTGAFKPEAFYSLVPFIFNLNAFVPQILDSGTEVGTNTKPSAVIITEPTIKLLPVAHEFEVVTCELFTKCLNLIRTFTGTFIGVGWEV